MCTTKREVSVFFAQKFAQPAPRSTGTQNSEPTINLTYHNQSRVSPTTSMMSYEVMLVPMDIQSEPFFKTCLPRAESAATRQQDPFLKFIAES